MWYLYTTYQDVLQFHPCYWKWKNFIPYYGWIIFHWIYAAHFLYPLICNEHLGQFFFWLLWTVLWQTWKCKYPFDTLISFSFAIYPVVALLDHVFQFWGISNVLHNDCTNCISTNSVWEFPFVCFLTHICYFLSF